MNLHVHVGTEKTGSSYLQKFCGKNREYLRECGIWFPSAGRHEKRLQKGTISPGNAEELTRYIENLEWDMVSFWLQTRKDEAQRKGCKDLLLSNELLFAALSTEKAVNRFQDVAKKLGFEASSCLLMVRDPVDQALSLYKHRAKSGDIGRIEQWLSQDYFLPMQLSAFLDQIDASEIQFQLRKYSKQGNSIEVVFFNDWLKIDTPPVRIEEIVNPSLTLSELAVLRHVVVTRPKDRSAFYESFLSIPLGMKADGASVERVASAKVEAFICQFKEFWAKIDARLASDGGLEVPQQGDFVETCDPHYEFSDAQLSALVKAHDQSSSFRYAVKKWINVKLRRRIGQLIRRFFPDFRRR